MISYEYVKRKQSWGLNVHRTLPKCPYPLHLAAKKSTDSSWWSSEAGGKDAGHMSLVAKAFYPLTLQTKQLCNDKKPGCAWISDTKVQKAGRKQRICSTQAHSTQGPSAQHEYIVMGSLHADPVSI